MVRLAATFALALLASPAQAQDVPEDALPSGPTVVERLATIQARIQGALVYPSLARARALEGETHVRFRIDAAGTPEGVEVSRSSGHASLDRAALRAVQDAAPLPFVWGALEVPVRFELDG